MEYIVFICLQLILLLLFKRKQQQTIVLFMFLVMFIFTVFRFDVGQDYQSYYKIGLGYQLGDYERFEYVSKIIYQITWYLKKPQIYFIICTFIIYYYLYKGIKVRKNNIKISIYIYICIFLIGSFSTIRQSMAEAYIIYISSNLFDNNKKYIVLLLLGIFFHETILISFIFIILTKIRFKNKKILLFLNFSYFYGWIILNTIKFIPYIPYQKLVSLINDYSSVGSGGGKWIYLYMGINFILIILKNKIIKTKEYELYLNIVVLGAFIYGIFKGLLGYRVSSYFFIFYILLIPNYYEKCKKSIKLLIILFFTMIFLFQIYIGRVNLIPYKNILYQNDIIFRDEPNKIYKFKLNEIKKLEWRRNESDYNSNGLL